MFSWADYARFIGTGDNPLHHTGDPRQAGSTVALGISTQLVNEKGSAAPICFQVLDGRIPVIPELGGEAFHYKVLENGLKSQYGFAGVVTTMWGAPLYNEYQGAGDNGPEHVQLFVDVWGLPMFSLVDGNLYERFMLLNSSVLPNDVIYVIAVPVHPDKLKVAINNFY